MPGVIMENGSRNGSHTNHDRDQRPNGINGASHASEKPQDKGKGRAEPQQNVTPTSPVAPNGLHGAIVGDVGDQGEQEARTAKEMQDLLLQLPPELNHITYGYISLKEMLSRLAQKTHSDLICTITELAQMPLPASALNGNSYNPAAADDNSPENVNKKVRLLQFLQSAHDSWTKALVIAGWSRRAAEVSRVIDLHVHLSHEKNLYLDLIEQMANDKRELNGARLLNPDLKTALEVLTTGKASWMPDLNYIQPPPLTAKEILKYLEKSNTLLSMRLNLTDYDSIPIHFKHYTIGSGRATFEVTGEFEVDLTIADEDPDSQFWFIDFRFVFTPSVSMLSPHIKFHIESKVNEALLKEGLSGCYKFLHELVLTHKISEYRRQSNELARGKWINTLEVEPLNRSLSVQYWKGRSKELPRSWFIMGVGGPRRKTNLPKSKATSHLYLRWFRDGKEVENPDIGFDSANISAETLLRTVVGKHSAYILESMHDKLRAGRLYSNRDLGLSLHISDTDPTESVLKVQLTNENFLSVQIQPITGRFVLSPAPQIMVGFENTLNTECSNPAANGHTFIEHLRSISMVEAIKTRAVAVGWEVGRNPGFSGQSLKDELKEAFKGRLSKDYKQILWLRRPAWDGEWYLAVFSGMSGEQWILLRTTRAPNTTAQPAGPNSRNPNIDPNLKISTHIILPIKAASLTPTYSFLSSLNIFTAGLVSHYANLLALHKRRCGYMLRQGNPSKAITFPSIYIRISDILPWSTRKDWVRNAMRLTFQGLEIAPSRSKDLSALPAPSSQLQMSQLPLIGSQSTLDAVHTRSSREENTVMIVEARMIIPLAKGVGNISERVDQDIAFDSRTGSFAFRLRCKVGQAVIDKLLEVAVRVERLVDFVQVLQKHDKAKSLACELVSLGKITFTYGSSTANTELMDIGNATGTHKATVDFTTVENGMALVLGKDNPHLRIVDQLTRILNSSEGLDGVATLLPQTLPVLRGLEIIEVAWTPSPFCERGEVFVNVRAADWYIIRYNIRQLAPQNSTAQPATRKIMFDIRMRQRRGEPWWYIKRSDNSRAKEADTLDEVLKPLWASSGPGWRGMRVSGVAQASGVQELLEKVDDVVRSFAMAEETVGESIAAQVQAATAPRSASQPNLRQQQQQRQLQTPNQSQSQSQGRNSQVKSEIVEID